MTESIKYTGRPIYSLQTMLRVLSQGDSRILPVIPDGIYGGNTYAAVRSYQEISALPPTGTVDYATWSRIVSDYNASDLFRSVSTRPQVLQAMLSVISEYYPALKAEAGLKRIQAASGLPQNGIPTPDTLQALYALYRSIP